MKQEGLGNPKIKVIPWEHFICLTPTQIECGVNASFRKCLLPGLRIIMLAPSIESAPKGMGTHDQSAETAVTASENALQERQVRVMPLEIELSPSEFLAKQLLPSDDFRLS